MLFISKMQVKQTPLFLAAEEGEKEALSILLEDPRVDVKCVDAVSSFSACLRLPF